MLTCQEPYLTTYAAFPCGKCSACLSKRRRTWAHRINLETLASKGMANFVTLTYAGEIENLEPSHLTLWLKRLRKGYPPNSIRYFAAGEYGERGGRPHFHVALWGLAPCAGGPNIRIGNTRGFQCICRTCSAVRQTWGYGHTMVAGLSEKSAMYIAGYVVKKMTHSSDPRLNGRHPEFSRMSLRPGIGAAAMASVVSTLKQYRLPVPLGLRHGDRILPLGKYLRRQVAKALSDGTPEGISKALNSQEAFTANVQAVRLLRQYAWSNELNPKDVLREIVPTVTTQLKKGSL